MKRTAKHPCDPEFILTFESEGHTYTDNRGGSYVSATTLIKQAFPCFNASEVAAKCAAKQGKKPEELIAEWEAKRKAAADYGTRLHANAEATINGQPRPNSPKTAKEVTAFKCAAETAKLMKTRFGDNIEAEKLVFSPFYGVAGTIDLLGWSDSRTYTILDWKTNEEIKRGNTYQSCCVPEISHVEDCDFNRYAMQLSLYELILRREAYIEQGATVRRFIVWIPPEKDSAEFMEAPSMKNEVIAVLMDYWLTDRVLEGHGG